MKLLEKVKRLNEQFHCKHDWKLVEPDGEYYDATGFHVIKWKCNCKNCGREQIRKFY